MNSNFRKTNLIRVSGKIHKLRYSKLWRVMVTGLADAHEFGHSRAVHKMPVGHLVTVQHT